MKFDKTEVNASLSWNGNRRVEDEEVVHDGKRHFIERSVIRGNR